MIRVLDVVTDLVIKNACRIDDTSLWIRFTECFHLPNITYRTDDKWIGSPIICESRWIYSILRLVKPRRIGHLWRETSTCLHQDRSSCLRRCRKEMPFLRGYQRKRTRQKVMDWRRIVNLRPRGFASDKRFNELLVLLWYWDIVISHKIIEHHFRRVFMLPFLAFPVVYGISKIWNMLMSKERKRWSVYASKKTKKKKKKKREVDTYNAVTREFP